MIRTPPAKRWWAPIEHAVTVPRTVDPYLPPGSLADRRQPSLEAGEHFVLRPFEDGDAPAVVAAYADPAIRRWHIHALEDVDEALTWIARWPADWEAERGGSWAIADRASGEVAGRLGLREVVLDQGCAELSYWVVPGHRGRGAAAAAVTAASGWLFSVVGFRRLEIAHSVANVGSCRVAGRAGFDLEGTQRSALRHADGWHDMHLHARLDDDGQEAPTIR